jgi:hypothetical protein
VELIERVKNDSLLPVIIHAKKSINGFSFLTLFLFRILILAMVYSLTKSTIIIIPLTFYFIFNLIQARFKHIVQKTSIGLTVLTVFFSLVITLFFYLSFTAFSLYVYHIPPELLFPDDYTVSFAVDFNLIILIVNLIHMITGLSTFIIIIVFSLLKGNSGAGISLNHPWPPESNVITSLFSFKGRLSRTGLLYNLVILGVFSYLVFIVLAIVLLALEDFSLNQLAYMLNSQRNVILISCVSCFLFVLNTWIYLALITKRLYKIGWIRGFSILIYLLIILSTAFHPVFINYYLSSIIYYYFSQAEGVIISKYYGPLISIGVESLRTLVVAVMALLYFLPGKQETTGTAD